MKIILSLQLFNFSKGLKNVETAVVNEPSVFEPLKFYCNYFPLIDKSSSRSILGGNVPAILYSVLLFSDVFSLQIFTQYSMKISKTVENESE